MADRHSTLWARIRCFLFEHPWTYAPNEAGGATMRTCPRCRAEEALTAAQVAEVPWEQMTGL